MTVPSTTNKIIYLGDGSTTVFPYTFKIFETSDLLVQLYTIADGTTTDLTETTHYSVSGAGEASGGNVTTVSTYSSDYKIIIRRVLPLTQLDDLVENDPALAENAEKRIDKSVMRDQQIQEQLDRAILQDATQSSNLIFPAPDASKAIGWNASGDGLENQTSPSTAVAEAAAYAAQAAASASAAQGTKGTFTNGDLVAGVLTITHNLGLSTPFLVDFLITDNNHKTFEPDDVTFATNTITVDLSSFGTISGTWAYLYGGSPSGSIEIPDPTGGSANQLLRVNGAVTEYELFTPSYLKNVVEDVTPQLGGDLDVNSNSIVFPTTTITDVVDEDNMASNSNSKLATQQSIKAYVDAEVAGVTAVNPFWKIEQTGSVTAQSSDYQIAQSMSSGERYRLIVQAVGTSGTNVGMKIRFDADTSTYLYKVTGFDWTEVTGTITNRSLNGTNQNGIPFYLEDGVYATWNSTYNRIIDFQWVIYDGVTHFEMSYKNQGNASDANGGCCYEVKGIYNDAPTASIDIKETQAGTAGWTGNWYLYKWQSS